MPSDLSVVMIGRDEALSLPRALRSVQSIAGQLVFVDTGSLDDTRSVAQRFGAQVFDFAWINDFAAARNAGLEHASRKWILVLDCDEELADPSVAAPVIERICVTEPAAACLVEIDNLQQDGEVLRHEALRMFRNDERIRFRNPVHESVAESVYEHWPTLAVPASGFRLRHHGYAQGQNAAKFERNLAIMRAWVDREPLNIYASYKFGVSLQQLGKPEGLEWLGRGFELLDRRPDKATFPFGRALAEAYLRCLARYGLHSEAERVREHFERW